VVVWSVVVVVVVVVAAPSAESTEPEPAALHIAADSQGIMRCEIQRQIQAAADAVVVI
jgi:hypothetical protein